MSAELAQSETDVEELDATSILSNKEERELVWRRVFIGQSQREVATDMDIGKGTVSKVLSEYRSINDGDLEQSIINEFEGVVEPYGTRSAETIRAELVRDVYTIRQYREAKSGAADLGLSVSDNDFFGDAPINATVGNDPRVMPDGGRVEDGIDRTHYCEDCDEPLSLLYDDREDESVPIVCGHCGGTNTRRLATDGGQLSDVTGYFETIRIRECTRCGVTGDDSEEFGVTGVARIGGNLCVECVRELDTDGDDSEG